MSCRKRWLKRPYSWNEWWKGFIINIITRCKCHPSTVDIKSKGFSGKFDFKLFSTERIFWEIWFYPFLYRFFIWIEKIRPYDIYQRYKCQITEGECRYLRSDINKNLNSCITDGVFPGKLELANYCRENHRPASFLNSSKLFEKQQDKLYNKARGIPSNKN